MLCYDYEPIAYPCLSNLGYISSWCYIFIWYAHYEMELMNILWMHGSRGSSSHIYISSSAIEFIVFIWFIWVVINHQKGGD
jgi:hypothetical protein